MKEEMIKLHYNILSGDYVKGGEASSDIKKALMQLGIQNKIIKRVCVSAYETEMNIVIHSFGGSLDVYILKDKIEIKAEDKGPGIDNIDLAMKEGYSTATNYAREMGFGAGMGLPNMKKNCDDFYITSKRGSGTIIRMILYLKQGD
jgi:serine/threonine-protein kinase RsbT